MRFFSVSSLFSLLGLAAAFAYVPPTAAQEKPWRDGSIDKATQATCEKAVATPLPAADQPTAAERATLKDCVSRDLYYGIKVAQDRVAARKCAYVERGTRPDTDFAWQVAGPAVLMMVYANGDGVEKNLDLALRFACEAGGAPAETEARTAHLQKLIQSPSGQTLDNCSSARDAKTPYCHGVVDICDDLTSGAMGGVCASIASDIDGQKAAADFSRITQRWTPAQQAAFSRLEAKARTYFEAHARNEVDLSGTLRGAIFIEERDSMLKTFRAAVVDLEKGKAPIETPAAYSAADRKLNAVYAAALKRSFTGTINKDGIRQTQRAWLPYRDAWADFAAIRYPAIPADSVRAILTRERTKALETLSTNRD